MGRNPKLVEPVCRGTGYKPDDDEFPVRIAKTEELKNLRVHCFGRTSGLQGGIIGPVMSSVRIYRRRTFSRSWTVLGNFGVGGDSGAWVIDNEHGRVCGHVLAWCERNAIAYICPMEVLLEDIKRTLQASNICLPGDEDEESIIAGVSQRNKTRTRGRLLDDPFSARTERSSARTEDSELPDIARLDFGDRERLGLGERERLGLLGSGEGSGRQDSMFFRNSGNSGRSTPPVGKMAAKMEYPRFVGGLGERPMA